MTEEAFHGVMDSLRWLGIDWDEGPDVGGPHAPYRQSQRLEIYRETIDRLLAQGDAYRCYCTEEELEERREGRARARASRPATTAVPGPHEAERAAFEAEGRPSRRPVRDARARVGPGRPREGRGPVGGAGSSKDFVLVRSDGSPVFLLAVAVDDMLMEITHVIRGDDLLASAPRNAAVIEALGGTPPAYAHVPQVNGADGKPLSKRHGSTSVEAFREQGILPEALVNYLALLGWSKDAETTFLSKHELVESFEIERVSRTRRGSTPRSSSG